MSHLSDDGKRSKEYYDRQQEYLAGINGFTEEMTAGQKVEKIFNHEEEDMKIFREKNEALRAASTKALAYSSMMIPSIVSLSYGCYAVSACVGGLLAIAGMMDLGSLAAYLVYVRQECHAPQPVYPAGEILSCLRWQVRSGSLR